MNGLTRGLLSVAAMFAVSPALAHGPHDADTTRPVTFETPDRHPSFETQELRERINRLTHDVNRDAGMLTEDQQRVNALKFQAAQATVGKAPPLSPRQQNELVELQRHILHLNQDISRDRARLSADQSKLEAWRQ